MIEKFVSSVKSFLKTEKKEKNMNNIKAVVKSGQFIKGNGERRSMQFIELGEMSKIGLQPPQEARKGLVFDLEKKDYRVFNQDTVVGKLEQEEMTIESLKAKYNLK